jgi:Flp pilus assembly protein TadG
MALRERDERYPAIIIFGLMCVALLLAAGAAVDYARVTNMRESLEVAVKSASLAAERAVQDGLSDDEVKAVTMTYFDTTAAPARRVGTIGTPTVSIDRRAQFIMVDASGTVAMTVSRLGGIDEVAVPVTSTINLAPKATAPEIGSARSLAYSGDW